MLNSWRLVAGIVVCSGSGWKQRRVGSATHLIVRHGERTDGADVWSTPTAQSAVGEISSKCSNQSLEMQRQQSQVQKETLTNLGAAQVAKTTYDARDFQTKAFVRMKGFKGDEKAWPAWRYKFRVEASRSFRQAATVLDWAEDMYDQPISESDIPRVAAKENWVDMANTKTRWVLTLGGD